MKKILLALLFFPILSSAENFYSLNLLQYPNDTIKARIAIGWTNSYVHYMSHSISQSNDTLRLSVVYDLSNASIMVGDYRTDTFSLGRLASTINVVTVCPVNYPASSPINIPACRSALVHPTAIASITPSRQNNQLP
jgi:hypothetical protein